MATITSLGVGSGLDLGSIVSGLMAVEKQPLTALKTRQSTVESRISALGTLKSALASLQTAAGNLVPGTTQTLAEKFSSFTAKSADETVATATAKSGVAATKYTLTNITLASAEQVRKTETALGIPSGTGSGTLSIKVGSGDSVDVSVNNGASLTDIAKAINSSKAGVTASVINDGTAKHLVITAKESGANNTISITGSTGWEGFNFRPSSASADTNSWVSQQAATSASVDVNGLTITSQSNTISDAVSGLSINLLKASSAGTTINVTQDNTSSITSALNAFVTAYNTAASSMKSMGAYNATTKVAGALQGDAVLRSAQAQVSRLVTAKYGTGDLQTLSDLGISLQKDGTLKLDSTKLNKAIENDFAAVSEMVSAVGTGFKTGLNSLIDSSGSVTSATESANRLVKELQKRQEAMQDRLDKIEERYFKQFSALDTMIAGFNQTSSSLASMLSALEVNNSNK
ncbi:flagellar filament capping protein FliD [Dechloromonas agitata]|uniref:flagellar filament capping protein FliD n=1 Tax=Dechloromonas agitata TaxID=73030 RepID=UPI0004B6FBED|nr:flagellar filament capping protein FliD [Dechloromonas agitata]MDE1547389.1 flagellar filament capping protein FliD [Dechloromonas agitata]